MSGLYPSPDTMLQNLLWDTRLSGNERARLTPWLHSEHRDAVNVGIARLKAENPSLAKEVEKAYAELDAIHNTETVTDTFVVKIDAVEADEIAAEKPKRGYKKKSA